MDVFIPIVFPDYKISAFDTKWSNLGHAGILFLLGKTGATKYYEYGRYDAAGLGLVRKLLIPDAKVSKNGILDQTSLKPVLKSIAKQSGQGTRISGAYIEQSNGYQKAFDFVEGQKKQNTNTKRKAYGLTDNNCGTFMQETLDAAGVDTPWMLDPRPNSYIEELREKFRDLDYDPNSDTLTIANSP